MDTGVSKKWKLPVLFLVIGIILISGSLVLLSTKNSNKSSNDVEQKCIESEVFHEEDDTLFQLINDNDLAKVINSYQEFMDIFSDNDKVLNLLNDVVDRKFFQSKSLAVLQTRINLKGDMEDYISKIKINNNVLDITIGFKNKMRSDYVYDKNGNIADFYTDRTYFIQIDSKQITKITKSVDHPSEKKEAISLRPSLKILIIIMLAFVLIKGNKATSETKSKKHKPLVWLIIGIVIAIILFIGYKTIQKEVIAEWSDKPIIYLYPEKDTEVSINLRYKDKITVSYPEYVSGWHVLAKPNGDLIDLDTNKNLYSLYYETKNVHDFKVEKDGFVVKNEDTIKFLEEKLAILGLSDREMEEFIIYWLPRLQKNKYNYIRFATADEINENMPLTIDPKPDTLIRVLMIFKGLKNPIDVEKQHLKTVNRHGFVAVEWGGTEIK